MEEKVQAPFWLSSWFVIAALLLLPPVGIILMWISGEFKKNYKIILTVVTCLYAFFIFPLFISAVAAPFIEKSAVAEVAVEKVSNDTFIDQQLTGNWVLSSDGFEGNDNFEHFIIDFKADGGFTIDAKVAVSNQVIPMAGTHKADSKGNLFLTKESGEQIIYHYDLTGNAMILQYMEEGKIKLRKTEYAAPPAPPAAVEPVSIDLGAGMYTIGVDVPPGKYDITAISGRGNFFGKPGVVSEMMGVGDDHYIESYKNANFVNGNTIEIKSTLVVNLTSK